MARPAAIADAPIAAAAATPAPPQPRALSGQEAAAPSQGRRGAEEARILPEPLGGPPRSQKRHAADLRGREGLGDVDTRRLENAVWRLWLKENRGGLPPPRGAAEDESGTFARKASQAIGQRINFSRGPVRPKPPRGFDFEHRLRDLLGESELLQRSGTAGAARPPPERSPPPKAAAAAPCSCSLPEPLGGPSVGSRRFCVDPDGCLEPGDVGLRRMENATWRLWLKEHAHADKSPAADGAARAEVGEREGEGEEDDAFLQKAHDAIGWQLDFASIRLLHLKRGSFTPRDGRGALRLQPGHPEFREQLEDACRIFKTGAADWSRDEGCDKCLGVDRADDIIAPRAASAAKQLESECLSAGAAARGCPEDFRAPRPDTPGSGSRAVATAAFAFGALAAVALGRQGLR